MLKGINNLIGKNKNRLYYPIFLMCLDSLGSMVTYYVLYLTIIDIFHGTLDITYISKYTLICFIGVMLRILIYRKSYLLSFEQSFLTTGVLRTDLANHFRKLSLGHFSKNSKGYLINTLTTCLMLIVGTFFIDFRLAFAECIVIIISIPILHWGERLSKKLENQKRKLNETMVSNVLEYINGIKVFRAYGMQVSNFTRLKSNMEAVRKNGIQTEVKMAIPMALYGSLINFIVPISLLSGSYLLMGGDLKAESLIAFFIMGIAVSGILISFERYYIMLKNLKIASDNLNRAMDCEEYDFDNKKNTLKNYTVRFENVSFSYEKNKEVLHDISFVAEERSINALIGESGSGKSTIMNLITRFWDITDGEITIGGENIKNLNPDFLLNSVSVVFQDNILLSDTILNNISIGNPNATFEEVVEASKIACCHEFIISLPDGYNTKVSEGGTSLSGGEKQRICIARAILKNAPILLLDEFTASLDADNEIKINKAFDHLIKGKTVFTIAHRLHTIKNADQIILMNNGKIEEIGKHDELIKKKGHYYQMIKEQEQAKNK